VFINCLALLLHAIGRRDTGALRKVLKSIVVISVFALPAVLYMRLWSFPGDAGSPGVSAIDKFWVFLFWLNGYIVPFPLVLAAGFLSNIPGRWAWLGGYALFLGGGMMMSTAASVVFASLLAFSLVAAAALAYARPFTRRLSLSYADRTGAEPITPGGLLLSFAAVYLIAYSVLSQYPFYRYIVPLVPLAALFMGRFISDLWISNRLIAFVVLVIMLSSNILSAAPLFAIERIARRSDMPQHTYTINPREVWRWTPIRSDLVSYLGEISRTTNDPERCLVEAMSRSGHNVQTVKASWGELSLMYYFPAMRIISRHVVGEGVPDVVVRRDPYPLVQDASFLDRIREIPYEIVELPCPNVIWSNNPDPLFHLYQMPAEAPRLVLYRKKER
jgi:hypothetical protein